MIGGFRNMIPIDKKNQCAGAVTSGIKHDFYHTGDECPPTCARSKPNKPPIYYSIIV